MFYIRVAKIVRQVNQSRILIIVNTDNSSIENRFFNNLIGSNYGRGEPTRIIILFTL